MYKKNEGWQVGTGVEVERGKRIKKKKKKRKKKLREVVIGIRRRQRSMGLQGRVLGSWILGSSRREGK